MRFSDLFRNIALHIYPSANQDEVEVEREKHKRDEDDNELEEMERRNLDLEEFIDEILAQIFGKNIDRESIEYKSASRLTSGQIWAVKRLFDLALMDKNGSHIEPARKEEFICALEDGIAEVDAEWQAEKIEEKDEKNFITLYGTVRPTQRYKETIRTIRRLSEEELDKEAKKYVEKSTVDPEAQNERITAWLEAELAQKRKEEEKIEEVEREEKRKKKLKEVEEKIEKEKSIILGIVNDAGGLSAKVKSYEEKIKQMKIDRVLAAEERKGKEVADIDKALKILEEEIQHLRKGEELIKPNMWTFAHRLEGAQLQDIIVAVSNKVRRYLPRIEDEENAVMIPNPNRVEDRFGTKEKALTDSLTMITFSEKKLIAVADALTMSEKLNDVLIANELRKFILQKGKLIVENQVNLETLRKWADEQKRKTQALRKARKLLSEAENEWKDGGYFIIGEFKFTRKGFGVIGEKANEFEFLEEWAAKKMRKKLGKGQTIQRTIAHRCVECTATFTSLDEERKRCDECEKRIQHKYRENEKLLNHLDLDGNTNLHVPKREVGKKSCRDCGKEFTPTKYFHVTCLDCFQKAKEKPLRGAMKNKYEHKCSDCGKALTARDAEHPKCFTCFMDEMKAKGKWRGKAAQFGKQIEKRRVEYGGREWYNNQGKRQQDSRPVRQGNCFVCKKAGHWASECFFHKEKGAQNLKSFYAAKKGN